MLKHIVMWQLKEEAEGNNKQENARIMHEKFAKLQSEMPVIKSLHTASVIDDCPYANYDFVLEVELETYKALEEYQSHPAHLEAAGFVRSVVSARACVDYFL